MRKTYMVVCLLAPSPTTGDSNGIQNQKDMGTPDYYKMPIGTSHSKQRKSFPGHRSHFKRRIPIVFIVCLSFLMFVSAPFFLLNRFASNLAVNSKSQIRFSFSNSGAAEIKNTVPFKMTNTEITPFERPRLVERKLLSKSQPEGDGAVVRRSIGRPELKNLDPFLLLDEFSVSPPAGFPDHPHRGFETVTYMLKGAFTHQDFAGHKGTIKAGDLQWMTAGRGIVHCEMPASKGAQIGLQLWVNLSSKDKMIEPAYQELEGKDIPKVEKDGVRAIVIAGEALGIKSPVYTRTPTMFLDFTIKPGAVLHQPVPEGWNAFVYVLEGEAIFGDLSSSAIAAHHTVQLSSGNGLSVWNKSNYPCRFVLIGGQPLNEPVVQYGPFVMNNKQEIIQAIEDYQRSRNGFERSVGWHSDPVGLSDAE